MGKKKINKDNEDSKTSKKEEEKGKSLEKKDPVVKIIDKKAIVDQYFVDRNQYHIYEDKNNVYNGNYFSCTLNKSDLNKNNNKFYIIQLLEHDTNNSLVLFTRWGRVGIVGANDVKDVDENSGPKLFMKKYKDKTVKHNYQEIYIDYEAEVKKEDLPEEKEKKSGKIKKKFQTYLSQDVMDLINLIYDKQMINDNLHEIGYDSKKMPLGKLSSVTLTNGLNILKQIELELKNENPFVKVTEDNFPKGIFFES